MAKAKLNRKRTPAPALPPIPTDTLEGARLHGIMAALTALDTPLPEALGHGLELQAEDERELARRLGVPVLFITMVAGETRDRNSDAAAIEEFVAWRHRIAGKAA